MLKYSELPTNYMVCFADASQCPLKATCLRALAAQLMKDAPEVQPCIPTLSPHYIAQRPSPDTCEFYRSNQPVRFAQGMSHLFDELPNAVVHTVRRAVMKCFSCESYFYQCRKGERLITPEEQEEIARIFRQHVPELTPKFDGFVEKCSW